MSSDSKSKKVPEIGAILWGDRNSPAHIVAEQARALEASGVVDDISMSDQLVNLIPPQLWKPEHTGWAKTVKDPDSHPDPFVMSAYAHAAAPKLGITVATDSVRHGPAELVQTMLTLANLTEGRVCFHLGAGEIKQCRAFGWNRSQGVGRLEDLYQIFHKFWDSDGPIDFDGKYTKLHRAYLGGAKRFKPKICGLGGGPKLLDLTLTYADGMSSTAPSNWGTPEQTYDDISALKRQLVAKGRDPEAFGFGSYFPVLVHDDEEVVEKLLDNAIVKWLAAIVGRINQGEWRREGIEPPLPDDWAYFKDMYPYDLDTAFIERALSKTTREIVRKGWIYGTPKQVARQIQTFVDAGVSWVLPCDWSPLVLDAEDVAANQLRRNIEICRALKGQG